MILLCEADLCQNTALVPGPSLRVYCFRSGGSANPKPYVLRDPFGE